MTKHKHEAPTDANLNEDEHEPHEDSDCYVIDDIGSMTERPYQAHDRCQHGYYFTDCPVEMCIQERKTFFLVWPEQLAASIRYRTYAEAERAAQEITAQCPLQTFYVVQSIAQFSIDLTVIKKPW